MSTTTTTTTTVANPLAAAAAAPAPARVEIKGTRGWLCQLTRVPAVLYRLSKAKAFKGTATVGNLVKIPGPFGTVSVFQEVIFEGVVGFRVGDYHLAASIDYTAPKPVIDYHLDGKPVIIPDTPVCDHCRVTRTRHTIFVARNPSGRELRLGGTCAKSFWGADIFDEVSLWAGIDKMIAMSDESFHEIFKIPEVSYIDLEAAAGLCLHEVRRNGFVSKDRAEFRGIPATTYVVQELARYFTAFGEDATIPDHRRSQFRLIDQVLRANPIEALKWCDQTAEANPEARLWLNYAAARENGFVTNKQLGMLAFCLYSYVEATAPRTGDYVGTVGKRMKTPVELRLVQRHATDWGYVSVFADDEGNQYKAFGKIPHEAVGEIRACTFFVKEHSEYRGQKQTVINRITG